MKIKLAILEKDISYLTRIISVFSTKYADKFELYSFTDPDIALASIDQSKIDVLVANDAFDIDVTALPKRCAFAYFVDSVDIDTENDQRAICKFQKADLIYKQILSVYAEKAGSISGFKMNDDGTKVFVFTSPCGGSGASTMAAAAAMHFAAKNQKVLYLNIEKFGSSDAFFAGEGQFDMSDLIFALKSKKTNLSMKLESCVKQDVHGVNFYTQSKVALDMLEINSADILRLVSELQFTGAYQYIVVDMDFGMDAETLKIWRQSHGVVWVSDGSSIANAKIFRAFNALSIIEEKADSPLTNRLCLVYNKFSNKTGQILSDLSIRNIGGAPRYEHADTKQILAQLSQMDIFDKIL